MTDWRWTAAPVTLFGLHGSILVFLPLLLVFQLARWVVIAFFVWLAVLVNGWLLVFLPLLLLLHMAWWAVIPFLAGVAVLIVLRRPRIDPWTFGQGLLIRHVQRDRWLGPPPCR